MVRQAEENPNPAIRYTLLTIGWLSSSKRFYLWLVCHHRLGPWIRDYLDGKGLPLKAKVYSIALMWTSIGLSCYLVPLLWARLFMLSSAVLVSLYILKQKTLTVRRTPD